MSALPNQLNVLTRNRSQRRIVSVLARTSAVTVYEVPNGSNIRVVSMSVCNVGTTTATFRIHILAPGESASASNAIYYDNPLRGNATLLDDSIRYLNAGDRIVARSDTANAICIQLHGEEV